MATHELYLGGPGRANGLFSRNQFPSPAFDNTLAVFKGMPLAEHKATVIAALTRTLDFGLANANGLASSNPNDAALYNYNQNNVIAAADILDLVVIPANTLLLGVYAQVERLTGSVLTMTLTLDDGTTFGAAVDCNAAFSKMAAPNGAWVSAGAVSLATANFSNVPRMLRAAVTSISASNAFGNTRVSFSPICIQLQEGQF